MFFVQSSEYPRVSLSQKEVACVATPGSYQVKALVVLRGLLFSLSNIGVILHYAFRHLIRPFSKRKEQLIGLLTEVCQWG